MSPIPQVLSNDIRKPTALVHFERSLSLVEQKVMTLIIFHCQVSERDDRGFYYIKKNFIREFLGWDDSNNYPRIYEAFLGIYNNSVHWNLLGVDRTFKRAICRLIVSLLEPSETGQFIGFKLHPDLEPVIKDPKVFAKLKLVMLVLLAKPKYAYPLYELFADSYSRGQHSFRISLPMLKDYLGISGESYRIFKDFKAWILKPSLDSINGVSDFLVNYQTYRTGRTIGGLVFSLQKQSWQSPQLAGPLRELQKYYDQLPLIEVIESQELVSGEEQEFTQDLQRYGLSEADALAILEQHGLEGGIEIRDYVLSEIERRRGTADEIRHTGAYLARCFREGFGKRTLEERERERWRKNTEAIVSAQRLAREKRQAEINDLAHAFWIQQVALVEDALARMTAEEREHFDQRFIQANPIWARKYQEAGLDTPMLRTAFYKFAVECLLDAGQKDIVAFARAKGISLEAINLLQTMTRHS